jgi:hypothetical protein
MMKQTTNIINSIMILEIFFVHKYYLLHNKINLAFLRYHAY